VYGVARRQGYEVHTIEQNSQNNHEAHPLDHWYLMLFLGRSWIEKKDEEHVVD
jgi:hypothetical protein